jgi:hypothetical protein
MGLSLLTAKASSTICSTEMQLHDAEDMPEYRPVWEAAETGSIRLTSILRRRAALPPAAG